MTTEGGSDHGDQLARVYSPLTWDLYDDLDVSRRPRSPDWLHDRADELLVPNAHVLDAGCRDAAHLVRLALRHPDLTGVGVDPVPLHVDRGQAAVAAAGLQHRITVIEAGMERLPAFGVRFDFVWCRDVLEQVADLDAALAGVAQVLKPAGIVLVFTTVATELLEPREAAMLSQHLGNVFSNLSEHRLESSFRDAGLTIAEKDVIGTEWREFAEEREQVASTALLRLARLRRSREAGIGRHGADIYHHVEANLHWEVYQLLGKLLPVVYVLQPASHPAEHREP